MGRFLSRGCPEGTIYFLFSRGFFVRPGKPFLRPDPRSHRAGARRIIFLREVRAFLVRISNHFAKALSLCNLRKRHASWIIPRRTRTLPDRESPFSRLLLPHSSGEPVSPP